MSLDLSEETTPTIDVVLPLIPTDRSTIGVADEAAGAQLESPPEAPLAPRSPSADDDSASSEATPAAMSPADTLAGGIALVLAMAITQRGLGLLREVLFCRYLDPRELGIWNAALGFMTLAAPVSVLGLPGSFGRYVEFFRKRGQLRAYLRRMTVVIVSLALASTSLIALFAPRFAELVFDNKVQTRLTLLVSAALVALIAQNSATSLYSALRMSREVSRMQFAMSLFFALLGVAAACFTSWGALGIVGAYGIACLIPALVGGFGLRQEVGRLPADSHPLGHAMTWARVAPFALWLWGSNWFANLFENCDRYLLLHFGEGTESARLALVGQYHSARLAPLVFVGLAELLSAVVTPHLSRDWEHDRRDQVGRRMNLILKLAAIGIVGVCLTFMLAAPWLFQFAFADKYAAGFSVLPWTLANCGFSCLAILGQNYLWCAEKAKYVVAPLALGLLANIGLDFLLLPRFGLEGVVVGSALARGLTVLALYLLTARVGMKFDLGTILLSCLPLALGAGPWGALAALGLVAAFSRFGNLLFHEDEKTRIAEGAFHLLARARKVVGRSDRGSRKTGPGA